MAAHATWLMLLLVVGLAWLVYAWRRQHHPPSQRAAVQRLLKPRTPDDCLGCCQLAAVAQARPHHRVAPWREVKRHRGAPKRITTQGFACLTPTCTYYRITDAQVHALVGDGTHGKTERIQPFRCQACNATFSARRHTPLYRLKTPSSRVAEVLTALCEGLDAAASGRVFGYSEATIMRWLTRAGAHSATLHDCWFRHLTLPHLQLDELRTRLRNRAEVLWRWLALDPLTKIVPTLHLRARTQQAAHHVVHDLRQWLAPGCIPIFTSDGLNLYFYALTAHSGHWMAATGRRGRTWQLAGGLVYGQVVKKTYRRQNVIRVSHEMRCGTREQLCSALTGLGLSGTLNTAFIERVNLTVRQRGAAFVRRTWSMAQTAPHLLVHLEWWRAYSHFARPHASLRVTIAQPVNRGGGRLPQRYRQRTPAMAAGLTHRRWTVWDLWGLPLLPTPLGAA